MYFYIISYHHKYGIGTIEVKRKSPIYFEDLESIRLKIETDNKLVNVGILAITKLPVV